MTPNGSRRSGFDALRAYARKHGHDLKVSDTGRTLVVEASAIADVAERFCGVHRIQRIPEGATRRHTSTISVVAIDDTIETVVLDEADVVERFQRGSGPGGQHRNKTDSCVVVTHIPTGIQAKADCRSQWESRVKARKVLSERIAAARQVEAAGAVNADRNSQVADADRAAKTFTYNQQRNEVVDHETGRRWDMKRFMRGKW